jgi:formylglycine-generating enzyme required for sulfatase activity
MKTERGIVMKKIIREGRVAALILAALCFMAGSAERAYAVLETVKVGPSAKASSPAGTKFRECPHCPEMIVIPAGTFTMGTPDTEQGRDPNEGPQHAVTIPKAFAVGVFHITVDQYAAFVKATHYPKGDGCSVFGGTQVATKSAERDWSSPDFPQTGRNPVVCVSWDDAKAYLKWLNGSLKGAKPDASGPYRLLTEAEWEYSARAGTKTRYFWGDDQNEACKYANGADISGKKANPVWVVPDCDDGYVSTAPEGTFKPNAFGLHDIVGNAWQWVEDCFHEDYLGAPTDGSAQLSAPCEWRSARGGSWRYDPVRGIRSGSRGHDPEFMRYNSLGFRVARTLD